MQPPAETPQPRGGSSGRRRATLDASLQADEALQLIAEGVTKVAGFGVAAISVAREDGHLHVTAVAGSEEARAYLEGTRTPVAELLAELERGDQWGRFRFVPHDRMSDHEGEWGWVPDVEAPDVEGAWHPLDLLAAPLLDAAGRLRGTLSIDLPSDGRVPGPEQRRVLDLYAEQAAQAVVTALEREELAAEVRLATAARRAVRTAPEQQSLQQVLDDARGPLLEGFGALGLWLHVSDGEGPGLSAVHSADGRALQLPAEVVAIADRSARSLWQQERVAVVDRDRHEPLLSPEQEHEVRALLADLDVGAAMIVPLGLGAECVGVLVLTRPVGGRPWSDAEEGAALEVGRDLGGAVLRAQLLEREHRLVEQLRELDGYRTRMVATVSHELRNPLTAIVGHLELLEGHPGVDDSARSSVSAMEAAAHRLTRLADDLLVLGRVTAMSEVDPSQRPALVPVDLLGVVVEAVDLLAPEHERRGQRVEVRGAGSTVVLGDRDALDHLVSNLVGNATKYTPDGGHLTVEVAGPARPADEEVVLSVADDGLGIAEDDLPHLFTEFFRSDDDRARRQRGTGLGLSIVRAVVERHGATIEVDSQLGRGSTFRVRFPAPPAPLA